MYAGLKSRLTGYRTRVFNHIPLLPLGRDNAVKGLGDTWEIVKLRRDGIAHYVDDPG